ncbi:hypothetical protein [Flavobacterium johnsoniae]|uniref:Uncharacterized protein n=1 Tax=Flavobacterium johnsoniae TaxID=986 RepID=A0A1J7C6A9_FLAJO|nr:hypothetical protein [Flavobacterium johnsoniae]OIV41217.1 hypothetical protein BKM63_11735 [Flavobacterium johnsoniae]
MKKYLFIILLLCVNFSKSQSIKSVDSLNIEICKSLVQNKNLDNEIRINTMEKSHIFPYLSKFNDTIIQKKIFTQIYYRLVKNCDEFKTLFPAKPFSNGYYEQDKEPIINISTEQCNHFDKISKYYYIEGDGKKVEVTLNDNLWIEKFEDDTYSKLYYRKKSNCQFELEFIESNNLSRGNLSVKGEKYLYKIFNKENETYSVYLKNKETYYIFKVIKQ